MSQWFVGGPAVFIKIYSQLRNNPPHDRWSDPIVFEKRRVRVTRQSKICIILQEDTCKSLCRVSPEVLGYDSQERPFTAGGLGSRAPIACDRGFIGLTGGYRAENRSLIGHYLSVAMMK